ncbi:MAG: S1 RNA-binding domain-containing protein, partial [Chloroflexi bacterium]|nr:S1 RNA-binding domain-containing protein [Chloroflexota bacterium]
NRYNAGDLVEGEVSAVVEFGAFVRVAPNVEGLIHVSEFRSPAGSAPQTALQPGEKVLARIINIDPDEERLALSLRRVSPEEEIAWLAQRDDEQRNGTRKNGSGRRVKVTEPAAETEEVEIGD